jgi:hypothetical protein
MSAEKQKQPSQFGNSLGDMSMEQPEKDPNSTMQYNNEEPTAEQHPINSIASASKKIEQPLKTKKIYRRISQTMQQLCLTILWHNIHNEI